MSENLLDKAREAGAREKLRRILAQQNPHEAAAYDTALQLRQLARAEREKRAHEAEVEAELPRHLARCGLGDTDAAKVALGLSATWARERGGEVDAVDVAQRWWASSKLLLLLSGGTGTGKTMACGGLMARCRLEYHRDDWGLTWCWPTTVPEMPLYFLARPLSTGPAYGPDAERLTERLTRCRLLVLDELGTDVMGGPYASLVDTVVVRRHAAGLRTVLSGNVGPLDVEERYGRRVWRRLEEDGVTVSLGEETLSGRAAR